MSMWFVGSSRMRKFAQLRFNGENFRKRLAKHVVHGCVFAAQAGNLFQKRFVFTSIAHKNGLFKKILCAAWVSGV